MRTNGPVAAAEEEEEGVADVEKKRGGKQLGVDCFTWVS